MVTLFLGLFLFKLNFCTEKILLNTFQTGWDTIFGVVYNCHLYISLLFRQIHCDPQVAAPRSSTRCTAVTAVSWSGSPTDQPTLHRHRYLSAKEIVLAIHPAPSVAAVEFTPSGKLKQCRVWELCFIYLMVASFTSEKAVA